MRLFCVSEQFPFVDIIFIFLLKYLVISVILNRLKGMIAFETQEMGCDKRQ